MQLREAVEVLRGFIQSGFQRQVEDKVLTDLAGHDTVQYIQRLEQRLEAASAEQQKARKSEQALRISMTALQRQLHK